MADQSPSSSRELGKDAMILIVIGMIAAGAAWMNRSRWLAPIGQWLQNHHVTAAHGGLITIPYLGGLDLPRLVAAAAVLGLVALVSRAVAGRLRTARDGAAVE